MSIALPPEVESFVDREVAMGTYASREDVIVAAVELLRQRQADLARLKADIEEGLQGEGIPAEQVFAELRRKFAIAPAGKSP
jgi:putative addiction module CopG family antidote